MMNYRSNKFEIKFVQILLCIVIVAITFVITMKELGFDNSDFSIHMNCAINIRREFKKLFTSPADFPFQLAYPMWHILVNISYKISRIFFGSGARPEYAAALVTGFVNGCTYFILIKILSFYACNLCEWIAFGLCFVMPIFIPGLKDEFSYFAQGSPVIWHNPTNMIAKPFALAGFFLIIMLLKKIKKGGNISRKECLVLSSIILLSVLAKPSFFQGIVPTLGIYILIQSFRTKFQKIREYFVICICFIPGFLIILGQFLFSFYFGKGGGGIGIGWMEVAKAYYPYPLLELFLVLAFPIAYILCAARKVWKKTEIHFAVLYVLCSWLEFTLLYENGERKFHGNFEWAVCLAYAVIWTVASMMFFKDRLLMGSDNRGEKIRNLTLSLLWMMHFMSGLFFVWNMLTVQKLYF